MEARYLQFVRTHNMYHKEDEVAEVVAVVTRA